MLGQLPFSSWNTRLPLLSRSLYDLSTCRPHFSQLVKSVIVHEMPIYLKQDVRFEGVGTAA